MVENYNSTVGFFWKTGLSVQRQEAIVAWLKSLPQDNRQMVDELMEDSDLHTCFNNSPDQ